MDRKLVVAVVTAALLGMAAPGRAQLEDTPYPIWCSDPLSCFINLYRVLKWVDSVFTPACAKNGTCPPSSYGAPHPCEEPEFAGTRMCQRWSPLDPDERVVDPSETPLAPPIETPIAQPPVGNPDTTNTGALLDQPLPAVAVELATGIRVPRNETAIATVCGWVAIGLQCYGGPKAAMTALRGYRAVRMATAVERSALRALRAETQSPSLVRGLEAAQGKILFGQESIGEVFRHSTFKGRRVVDLAAELRSGRISPDQLPLDVIIRNGEVITLNNRSLAALRMAGMAPTRVINRTGRPQWERLLNDHLRGMSPSATIRVRPGRR